jgi:hypothetical protein
MGTGTWVPLVTAAAGLIAGLATGLGGAILARRWAVEDRAAQWEREDALRWHEDRLQVYVRLISALDAFDAEMRSAMGRRAVAESFDTAEWARHEKTVRELVMLVSLTAPQKVRDLAGQCTDAFAWTGMLLLGEETDAARIVAAAEEAALRTRRLIEAMRADLGLGGEGQPAAGTGPRPPG